MSHTIIAGPVGIIDDGATPLRGKWQYVWATNNLSVADIYESEIEVTWSDRR